jgi:DNA-binding CsgD family transcriptional regulator
LYDTNKDSNKHKLGKYLIVMKQHSLKKILKGRGTEMFAEDGEAFIIHAGHTSTIEDACPKVKSVILDYIESDKKMNAAYEAMAGANPNDKIAQCIKCRFANLDGTPDIDEAGKVNSEYVTCEKRGTCPFEGIACDKFAMINGVKVTDSEIRVLNWCFLDAKTIADKLFMSHHTVNTHSKNIRSKLGIESASMLASVALDHGFYNINQLWNL